MPETTATRWIVAVALVAPIVPLSALLTALLERSGPIRMRHWVQEAGGRLRGLYEETARFEVFRYLLNLAAKLAPIALLGVLARVLAGAGLSSPWLVAGTFVAVVVAATELANRSLVVRDPEDALRRLTWLYRAALIALTPLVVLLTPLAARRRALAEPSPPSDDEASEEEVEAFIDVGTKEGILEPADRELVWGVVDFGDTQVRSVMTPRVDVVSAFAGEPLDRLAEVFVESSVSRLPLHDGSIDHVVGVLHLRDLFAGLRRDPQPTARELAKPPMLVPGTKLLGDLLKELQSKRQQMAIVIDEWGGTEGLVTLEDLIEEIVGEIEDEHDVAEPENRMLDDGSLRLDGRAPLGALDEFFAWRPETETSETVGGLVSGLVGYVPRPGEVVEHDGLRFEVERSDERRILALRVRRAQEVQAPHVS